MSRDFLTVWIDITYCCQVFMVLLFTSVHLYVSIREEREERCAPPSLLIRQCDESVAIEQHYFVVLFSFNWIICVGIEV